jgi:hypothetical protein
MATVLICASLFLLALILIETILTALLGEAGPTLFDPDEIER